MVYQPLLCDFTWKRPLIHEFRISPWPEVGRIPVFCPFLPIFCILYHCSRDFNFLKTCYLNCALSEYKIDSKLSFLETQEKLILDQRAIWRETVNDLLWILSSWTCLPRVHLTVGWLWTRLLGEWQIGSLLKAIWIFLNLYRRSSVLKEGKKDVWLFSLSELIFGNQGPAFPLFIQFPTNIRLWCHVWTRFCG